MAGVGAVTGTVGDTPPLPPVAIVDTMSFDALDRAKYVSLTTFKRDGSPVASPVWLAGRGGTYVIMTADDSWKVKRLRNDPRVEVAPSNGSGKVEPGAPEFSGMARLLDEADSIAAIDRVRAKYGFMAIVIDLWHKLKSVFASGPGHNEIGVEITVEPKT